MGLLGGDLKGAVDEAALKLEPLAQAFLDALPGKVQDALDGLTITITITRKDTTT